MVRFRLGLVLAIALCGAFFGAMVGCASKRTFPPVDGETLLDTSLPPAPEVMRIAIAAAHARGSTAGDPIVFNLPPNVQRSTWRRITEELGGGARPMAASDTLATSVERVRLDGGQAWVDVVVPQGGAFQLFTVHLRGGGLAGWTVTYVQPWTVRTDPPTSHSPWANEAG
jgi:hypothetical protein